MFDDAPLGLDLSVLWFAIYGSFFFFFVCTLILILHSVWGFLSVHLWFPFFPFRLHIR